MRKFLRKAAKYAPGSALKRRIVKAFQCADREGDERIAGYFHWLDPALQWSLYSQDVKDILVEEPFSFPLLRTLSNLPSDIHPLNKMLYLEGKHFLPDHNLNYTDKMSMAVGVEVRVPLLDLDLIALAASLPIAFKQKGKQGKWIFKKAMERFLPRDVIYRPKTGFGAPLRKWLKNELRPLVDDVLSDISLKSRGLFDPQGVWKFVKMDRAGQVDGTYPIFALVCIELWCRMFVDGGRF